MADYSYLNQYLLNMYVTAVDTGRFTIDFVPFMYRQAVADTLGITLN
ncbi:hypothetical protein GCM10008986_16850 [Salinibacillus aidingensis]|uniref:Uncharacterized protein n=1 Tax=Salinibacillus aidingensis TaxID=237684 RepID=A0ABN1B6N9_9BACI